MAEVEVPQEAVEAAHDVLTEYAPVHLETSELAVFAAAPLLLAHCLRVIGDEMRDVPAWLAERRISDSAGPGFVLASVRAALYATADGLDAPDVELGVRHDSTETSTQVEGGVRQGRPLEVPVQPKAKVQIEVHAAQVGLDPRAVLAEVVAWERRTGRRLADG